MKNRMVYAARKSNKFDSHYTILYAVIRSYTASSNSAHLCDPVLGNPIIRFTCTVYPNSTLLWEPSQNGSRVYSGRCLGACFYWEHLTSLASPRILSNAAPRILWPLELFLLSDKIRGDAKVTCKCGDSGSQVFLCNRFGSRAHCLLIRSEPCLLCYNCVGYFLISHFSSSSHPIYPELTYWYPATDWWEIFGDRGSSWDFLKAATY